MEKLKRYLPYITVVVIGLLAFIQATYLFNGITLDALKEYYPLRFYSGECLQNGEFPWWNPLWDMGSPVHADPASGTWYPFTWLISGTAGYSLIALKIEYWFHVFLGGVGFFMLTRTFFKGYIIPLFSVALYLASGFAMGGAEHLLFAVSLCWVPFVLRYFIRLCRDQHHTDAIKASLFLFLLASGGEWIISFSLMLLLALIYMIFGVKLLISKNKKGLWKLSFRNFQFLTYVILFSLSMLLSCYQVRPYLDPCETSVQDKSKCFTFSSFTILQRDYPLLYSKVKENGLLMLSDSLLSTEDLARYQAEGTFERDQLFMDPFDLEYLKQRTLEHDPGDTVILRSNDARSFHIKTTTKHKCLLTLHQKHYKGWKATVNGRKARIFKSNLNFMTIIVPPGENEVTFDYANPLVKYAFFTNIFFMVTALTTLAYSQWKKARRQI